MRFAIHGVFFVGDEPPCSFSGSFHAKGEGEMEEDRYGQSYITDLSLEWGEVRFTRIYHNEGKRRWSVRYRLFRHGDGTWIGVFVTDVDDSGVSNSGTVRCVISDLPTDFFIAPHQQYPKGLWGDLVSTVKQEFLPKPASGADEPAPTHPEDV